MLIGDDRKFFHNYLFLIIVLILSFLAALPQLMSHSVILGVDGLFHFNRFYDVAEQFRHFNFHYFIAPYASRSVGRMINSIYGPMGALLNGLLLLIAGNYVRYQILSRIVLSLIAAISMDYALRQLNVDRRTAQIFAIVYPFTYQVIIWNVTQAFTGWGAALLPLGIMLGIRMIASPNKPINSVQMAVVMALIVQVHLVSAVEVVLVLTVYAIFGLFQTNDYKDFIFHLAKAVGLFSCLSANVIAGFVELYIGNRSLGVARITNPMKRTFDVLTLQPAQYSALLILVISLVIAVVSWRRSQLSTRVTMALGLVFFGLSMPILPWNIIFAYSPIVATIQFPERFVAIGTALLLIADAQIIAGVILSRAWRTFLKSGLILLGFLMVMMNFYSTHQYSQKIFTIPRAVYPIKPHTIREKRQVRQLFTKTNLTTPLTMETKSTPDYLPLQKESTHIGMAGYQEFDRVSYHPEKGQPQIKRTVKGGQVTLRWVGHREEALRLPVAFYSRTQAKFNQQTYHFRGQTDQYLRFPVVQSQPGNNQFTFSYQPRLISKGLVGLALISWAGILSFSGWRWLL